MGWIQCHYFVKDSTMDNWIFMPRVPQSVLHLWENMVDRGEKGARQGWDGMGGELHRVVPQDWRETQYMAEF